MSLLHYLLCLGNWGNSFFLSLAPPTPIVTSFFFWRMPSPCACQVLSLAVNNHFDPSRTEGLHGISQPISPSISQSQIPGHPVQPCAQQSVQLCACILKKGLCQLFCIPCPGSRAGERWGEAHTSQHSPLTLPQGLGCFLLLYLSFLGAANLSLHKNTPSTSTGVNLGLAIPPCYCCS